MKMRAPTRSLLLLVATAVAALPAISLRGADTKADKADSKASASTEKKVPLKLNIDRKPINRDAPDRVSYAAIVKRTTPNVVYVYSTSKVKLSDLPFHDDPQLRRFFNIPDDSDNGNGNGKGNGNNNSKKKRSQQAPTQQGLGSGVVMTADGYVLTNNHVVEGADEVKVSIGDSNKKYVAKVVGRDPMSDVAVLKIEATGLSPAVFGDSDQVQVGDVVLAIGNPFGVGQSVSRGIVSALSRAGGELDIEDFIQTDAAINPGNSGGALIDTEGRVVGINSMIFSRSGGFNGVGFAIPINLVRFAAEQIVNKGKVERGMLGVRIQELTEELSAEFGTEKGALVAQLTEDSPAEKAGIKTGDVITKVNGMEVRDGRHLTLMVSQNAPGSEVKVDYLRDGKAQSTTVKLGLRPSTLASTENPTEKGDDDGVLNGVRIDNISPKLRTQLNIPAQIKGVIITDIDPDCPSAQQGLRENDVILELNRKPITNSDDAVKLSEEIKGPKVLVRIWRGGRTSFLSIDESKK